MYRLIAILMVLLVSNVFAHGHPEQHDLGEEANSIKASGKVFHTDGLDVIRKMHPEFLNHKRDKTLREGVRTKEGSLKGCVNCHSAKDKKTNQYHPVNDQDQFCSTCHQKVSVSVDCFSCHRTTPRKGTK